MPLGGLINLVVVLAIVGLILWAIQQIPMDAAIAKVIRVVVIVVVGIYLIYFLAGLFQGGSMGIPYPYHR